ncbi:hypothetical protein P152DRAFT_246572 [Eremomyces bilateralis CBS 781.70]|uniref:Uncharacterized protein n=1 Tax=Eremomyces bilateralis CBS 781.70 TaxID=1392243 RepID=A0A6G1GB35_9PEZI|nr:uncharacterized protein P152DRAFT_246572 [Eremomyces bilateralis CBS 781.70]KAF1815120.1 hypothetical protein P152DRAFT_246572 [Eremomyces bilateralis CBS 781.70]
MSMAMPPQPQVRAHPGPQQAQQPQPRQGNATRPPGDAQPTRAPQHPTERLQGMVNLMLVQTGRIFSDPSKRRGHGATVTRQQLMQIFPEAESNFHNALDELDADLQRSQAVLRRDLALARERRRKKEEEAQQLDRSAKANADVDAKVVKKEDVQMADAPPPASATTGEKKPDAVANVNGGADARNKAKVPAEMPTKTSPKGSSTSAIPKNPNPTTATTSAPTSAPSPSKAAFASIDFESIDSLFASHPGSPSAPLPAASPQPHIPPASPTGILDNPMPPATGEGNEDSVMGGQTLDDLFNSLDDLIGDSGTGEGDADGDVNFDFDFT